MNKIIIIGNGGHAKSVAEVIERQGIYRIAGYVVGDELENFEEGYYPVIGRDKDLKNIYQSGIHCAVLGIGFLGKNNIRKKLYQILKEIGYKLPIICDPSAIISSKASIGEGAFLGKQAIVNVDAIIGKASIINTGAIVEHDCQVGEFSHIAVGAVLCGEVFVGKETLVGANATVIQGRRVGDKCVVGAGEVVRKNIVGEEI